MTVQFQGRKIILTFSTKYQNRSLIATSIILIIRKPYMRGKAIQSQSNRLLHNKLPVCYPFVKWAGGKTQLLEKLGSFIPAQFSRYFEPFPIINWSRLVLTLPPQLVQQQTWVLIFSLSICLNLWAYKYGHDEVNVLIILCMREYYIVPIFYTTDTKDKSHSSGCIIV